MRWKLKEIARVGKNLGRKAWIRYGKIRRIDGKWWVWDEVEEVLRDQRDSIRGVRRDGEGEREKGSEKK